MKPTFAILLSLLLLAGAPALEAAQTGGATKPMQSSHKPKKHKPSKGMEKTMGASAETSVSDKVPVEDSNNPHKKNPGATGLEAGQVGIADKPLESSRKPKTKKPSKRKHEPINVSGDTSVSGKTLYENVADGGKKQQGKTNGNSGDVVDYRDGTDQSTSIKKLPKESGQPKDVKLQSGAVSSTGLDNWVSQAGSK